MKTLMLLTLVVCLAAIGSAQMIDSYKITLPRTATLNGVNLPGGEYTFRKLNHDNGSTILEIRSPDGFAFTALVTPISTMNNRASLRTELILQQTGDKARVEKLWLEGSNIGYEFNGGDQ